LTRQRRRSLLSACAGVALLAQPATAIPSLSSPIPRSAAGPRSGAIWFADASPKRGGLNNPINPPWHIADKAGGPKDRPQAGNLSSSPQVKGDRGTFDISVDVLTTPRRPARNNDQKNNKDVGPFLGPNTPLSPRASLDQLLVTSHASPPADQARVDNGAIVLLASPNSNGQGNSNNQGNGPPSNPGTGNGNGPPTDPGNGNGNGPPSDPGAGNGNGNGAPSDPGAGNGNGNGPPSDPGAGNGNGNGPPSDPGAGNGNGNGPPSDPGAGNDGGNGPPDGVPPGDPCSTGNGNPCGGNNGNGGGQGNANPPRSEESRGGNE
jgi:hypothetical protein